MELYSKSVISPEKDGIYIGEVYMIYAKPYSHDIGIYMKFLGTCFDINTRLNNTLLIGSEQGAVFETSNEYRNELLTTYEAHYLSVQRVRWNVFYKRIFLSCSSDWTVKIWDHRYK